MKKFYTIILAYLLVFTSCAHTGNEDIDIVSRIDDKTIKYKDTSYEYWSNASIRCDTDDFSPFLSDASTLRSPTSLNEQYVLDTRDVNSNFIYFDSGFLGTTVYKKKGLSIPSSLDICMQPEKIDIIVLRHNSTDEKISITTETEVAVFLNFLYEVANEETAQDSPTPPKYDFYIDALSSYYGGTFGFYEIYIYKNGSDFFLYPQNQKLPSEINEMLKNNQKKSNKDNYRIGDIITKTEKGESRDG